jgi:hypothetical protein
MNENFEQLRRSLLKADFELSRDIVHLGQRKIVGHGAMAGHIDASPNALDLHLMHVKNFRELLDDGFELLLKHSIAMNDVSWLNG